MFDESNDSKLNLPFPPTPRPPKRKKVHNLPTAIGDMIAKAPGLIISLSDAEATIATQRP